MGLEVLSRHFVKFTRDVRITTLSPDFADHQPVFPTTIVESLTVVLGNHGASLAGEYHGLCANRILGLAYLTGGANALQQPTR